MLQSLPRAFLRSKISELHMDPIRVPIPVRIWDVALAPKPVQELTEFNYIRISGRRDASPDVEVHGKNEFLVAPGWVMGHFGHLASWHTYPRSVLGADARTRR